MWTKSEHNVSWYLVRSCRCETGIGLYFGRSLEPKCLPIGPKGRERLRPKFLLVKFLWVRTWVERVTYPERRIASQTTAQFWTRLVGAVNKARPQTARSVCVYLLCCTLLPTSHTRARAHTRCCSWTFITKCVVKQLIFKLFYIDSRGLIKIQYIMNLPNILFGK